MSFKIGDVCIGQNHYLHTAFNGILCEIIGGFEFRRSHIHGTSIPCEDYLYEVRWANGEVTKSLPHKLRLKRPPQTGEEIIRRSMRT